MSINMKTVIACLHDIKQENIPEAEAIVRLRYLMNSLGNHAPSEGINVDLLKDAKYTHLEDQYNKLLKKYEELSSGNIIVQSGDMTHEQFRKLAMEKFKAILPKGSDKGLVQAFLTATNEKYNFGHWYKWRNADLVPASVVEDLNNLPEIKLIHKSHSWSTADMEILRSYTAINEDGHIYIKGKIDDIAKILSERFGTRITSGSVKSKLNVLRKDQERKPKVIEADFRSSIQASL